MCAMDLIRYAYNNNSVEYDVKPTKLNQRYSILKLTL